MATTRKLGSAERATIIEALKMQLTSQQRSARAAKTNTIKEAYEKEATNTSMLINTLMNGELEL